MSKKPQDDSSDFLEQSEEPEIGIVAEFLEFLVDNKKWWIAPIIIVLLIFALLIIFGGSAFAPFIYPFI